MKRLPFALLFPLIYLIISGQAQCQGIPLFGELPRLDKQWRLSAQGTNGWTPLSHSWVVFTNSQNGDVLSFDAELEKSRLEVGLNWSDRAGSIFPGGYPWGHKASPRPPWDWTVVWIRNNIMELNVGVPDGSLIEKALEYTFVLEGQSGTNYLAHGYAMSLGKLRVFVQNTSTRAITPELAWSMACDLIYLLSKPEDVRRRIPDHPRAPEE